MGRSCRHNGQARASRQGARPVWPLRAAAGGGSSNTPASNCVYGCSRTLGATQRLVNATFTVLLQTFCRRSQSSKSMRKLFAVAVFAAVIAPLSVAQAEKRIFIIANDSDGYGIDHCLATGAQCGTAAATAFCRGREYAQAGCGRTRSGGGYPRRVGAGGGGRRPPPRRPPLLDRLDHVPLEVGEVDPGDDDVRQVPGGGGLVGEGHPDLGRDDRPPGGAPGRAPRSAAAASPG